MSTAAIDTGESELPPLPLQGASPREVWESLHPEHREEFERAYREALDEAARTLDLSGVLDTIENWRCRCWVTRDRAQHRRIVRRAVELLTGEPPPEDEPVAVTEARATRRVPCERAHSGVLGWPTSMVITPGGRRG